MPKSEQVAVLRMLAARSKTTWTALKTWRGACHVELVGWYSGEKAQRFLDERAPKLTGRPAEFKKISQGRASFAVDLVQDRLFSRVMMFPDDLIDLTTGQPFALDPLPALDRIPPGESVGLVLPYHRTVILTPENYLFYEPDMPFDPVARIVFRRSPEEAQREWFVDPRKFLGYARPTWEELDSIAQAVEQTGWPEVAGQTLRIAKEGAGAQEEYRVVMPGRTGPDEPILIEMTFRADADFNVTWHVARAMNLSPAASGPNYQEIRWKYTVQDGLYLPLVVEYERRTPDGSRVTSLDTFSLIASEINQPITPETFTERNLGLQEGDRLMDKLAGSQARVFEAGTLKPITPSAGSDLPVTSPKPTR